MLNIPESIKALYLADTDPSVQRNFRVRFPNGELPDVNSDQIVQDSVQLTESIMSQNTFKFGLAEAPQIQFETVGVANCMGMTISCYHEIDTTILSAAELAEIQSGDYDGELVLEEDSDLGYGFYRTPLGTFRVESCPRNHGAMTRRRITAYTASSAADENSKAFSFERFKWSNYYTVTEATIDIAKWIYSTLGIVLPRESVSKTTEAMSLNVGGIDIYSYAPRSGFGVEVQVTLYRPSDVISGGVYSFEIPERVSEEALQTAFENAWTEAGVEQYLSESIKNAAYNSVKTMGGGKYPTVSMGATSNGSPAYYPISGDPCDTYYLQRLGINDYVGVQVAYSFRIMRLYNGSESIHSSYYPLYESIPTATKHTLSTEGIEYTLKSTGSLGEPYPRPYTFNGALPFNDLSVGVLELYGLFGCVTRKGRYKPVMLDDSSPYEVSKDQYAEMWYDEYDISEITKIIYNYNDSSNGEQTITLCIEDENGSVYDLSGNWILMNIPSTQEDAEAMITTNFVPNISGVDFTPIELSAKGLPWLEAGDAITVTTEDGETVTSYILERTLSGIRVLSDDIKSTGGELLSADTVEYGS